LAGRVKSGSRNHPLRSLRNKIDVIDERIVALLNRRARLASLIARSKNQRGGAAEGRRVFVPSREKRIFERLERLNRGPLGQGAMKAIFREIISACRAVQRPLVVAYLGPPASYTHQAATEQFGSSTHFRPLESVALVFDEVEQERADWGVVPVENSTEGMVGDTLDTFVHSPLKIAGELLLPIRHQLLARSDSVDSIRKVVSHRQALAQCRGWLARNLPGVELDEVSSTSKAAQLAAARPGLGAIASLLAASCYKLKVVASNIQDASNNVTRFLVVGRKDSEAPSGHDKTSILFTVRDEPGILSRLLRLLAAEGINLTAIESRPARSALGEYVFFLDLSGHRRDRRVDAALRRLERHCSKLTILGSYPCSR